MSTLKILIKENGKLVFSRLMSEFPILFGRGGQNHISLPKASYLSRTHGSIGFVDDRIIITDLNSTNGIFIDGKKISSATFSNNAFFIVGNFSFEIQDISKKPDTVEMTSISKRLVSVAAKLKFEVTEALHDLNPENIALQAVVTWGKDIFDVRQFQPFDFVIAGNSPFDPISVPALREKIRLGKYVNKKGELAIPFDLKWRLNHEGNNYDAAQVVNKGMASTKNNLVRFGLLLEDVCTIDLGNETSLHLRYVEVPRPFIPKTWIENREVFKKAIAVSLIIHLFFSIISIFSAEKILAPEVDNMPPRFAKLIVEPPKMLLAPPKIEEILPPSPLPEPEMIKEPEPKPEPKPKPKPIQTRKPIISPVAKAKPARDLISKETVPEKPNFKEPAAKSSHDETADSFSNMFAEVDSSIKQTTETAIKIDKSAKPGPLAKGVNIAGVAGALKSQIGKMQIDEGNTTSIGMQAGSVGYKSGGGGAAGKRKVISGLLGTPKLEESPLPQGITQDQVMSIVNKYLNDIHRCYERALMDDSNLSGRVEYEWNINPNGTVTSAKVKRSEMQNSDSLNKCVLAIFHKMKFPSAKNGQPTVANIGFPFGKI